VSRRYVPDDAAVLTALAGRVDTLDLAVTALRRDVTGLRSGIATLTAELRRSGSASGKGGGRGGNGDGDEDSEPQWDWLAVADVDTARAWLADIAAALDTGRGGVLAGHGLVVPAPCWALHPGAVAALLALLAERRAAYAGDRASAVLDWLTRWLPAATARLDRTLAACAQERAHVEGGTTYDARDLDLGSVAAWWAIDPHLPPAKALALPTV
jgi:hypothetical protein